MLTHEQIKVIKGIIVGAIISIISITYSIIYNPLGYTDNVTLSYRLDLFSYCMGFIILFYTIIIGRMARLRFFSQEDIQGHGISHSSKKAKIITAIIENTSEQTLLASCAYILCALNMPGSYLSILPCVATLFFIGRILFYFCYKYGAGARAVGFAITFYPTVITIFLTLIHLFTNILS